MDIKKDFKWVYLAISVIFIVLAYFVFRIDNSYYYFNLICFLIFLYYYITFYMPFFKRYGNMERTDLALLLCSSSGLFIFPGHFEVFSIGLIVTVLISKIIFEPKFYEFFGERIRGLPIAISLLMFFVGFIVGNLYNLPVLLIYVLFLIYVYNKKNSMKSYSPFLEE